MFLGLQTIGCFCRLLPEVKHYGIVISDVSSLPGISDISFQGNKCNSHQEQCLETVTLACLEHYITKCPHLS